MSNANAEKPGAHLPPPKEGATSHSPPNPHDTKPSGQTRGKSVDRLLADRSPALNNSVDATEIIIDRLTSRIVNTVLVMLVFIAISHVLSPVFFSLETVSAIRVGTAEVQTWLTAIVTAMTGYFLGRTRPQTTK